jgi:multidrug resistance efflux pump
VLFNKETHKIEYTTVDKGAVQQRISVFGRLKPRVSSSLVAQVDGHISQLNVLPGSLLNVDTVVLTLSNPQLLREYDIAKLNWQKEQAMHVSALAKLQREATQLANDVAMAESELKFAEQEIATLSVLHKEQLLSELDFLRAKTRLDQVRLKLDLTKRSEKAFLTALEFEEKALTLSLESEKQLLALTHSDVENLEIKTTQSGILTELLDAIEIGQAVSKGTVLAKLSDKNSLFAELLAPASAADDIKVGMPVEVEIKGISYSAQIVRVYPNVEANQIKLEAAFLQHVPATAISNLSIAANVLVANKENILRITKPLYLDPRQVTQTVYIYNDGEILPKEITVGLQGGQFIEILAGLHEGELVLSTLPENLRKL